MGRRSERHEQQRAQRQVEQTEARESLERRWFKRSVDDSGLARLVTGADLHHEPFHRWVPYTQGFSPALVRLFLENAEGIDLYAPAAVLDPFAGSGTVAIECARRDVSHHGVEAVAALAFLARCTAASEFPPLPNLRGVTTWQEASERLTAPVHRAALMLSFTRRLDSDGAPRADASPLPQVFNEVVRMMLADLRTPQPRAVKVEAGDARWLTLLDESVGGVLTSPPYLSRHDYSRITKALQRVYRTWHADEDVAAERKRQMRAHAEAEAGKSAVRGAASAAAVGAAASPPAPAARAETPAEAEAGAALRLRSLEQLAGVLRSYFDDLTASLRECARVLRPDCPCWMVLGGARLRDVYVPSDLIAAEIAREVGFEVLEIRVARRLISTGRKLGELQDVAPRESLLVMRRSASS